MDISYHFRHKFDLSRTLYWTFGFWGEVKGNKTRTSLNSVRTTSVKVNDINKKIFIIIFKYS
jgi:hypothetical protein